MKPWRCGLRIVLKDPEALLECLELASSGVENFVYLIKDKK